MVASPALAEPLPFEISVDGQRVDGTRSAAAGAAQAPAEKGIDAVDIQVKYSGLNIQPILNVSTVPPRVTFEAGEEVRFLMSLNYAAWIERAEIRITERGRRSDAGVVDTIDVANNGTATWVMPQDAPAEMEYVVRVYDAEGRFDETRPLPLIRSARDLATREAAENAVAPGYSEDRTAFRNIDVSGGAVTVYGKNIPPGHDVTIMGEAVPVDGKSAFVMQRILPPGQGSVEITVLKDGKGLRFAREIEIPASEWFYVGLADFTAGYRFNNEIEAVRPGEFDDVYTRGRLAFYAKGKIKGKYILTMAADTDEAKLKHIFKGLDEKNPREFLRRLDPDDYYPVYGDDSTSYEDAPTRGKFYIRLERGPSHVMWGNFKSSITGTKFLRTERALYGASAVYRSQRVTENGDAKTAVDAYAALPGTLPQRDVLRGTGGSAYFLKHQDISPGTETVSVERRNAVTGFVVNRQTLKFGTDYSIDYVQGVIILARPLRSSSGQGTENFLTVSYEFTPAARNVDGYAAGGRVQQWVGDHVRLGVTAQREKTGTANQTLYGADVRVQKTPDTYVEAEVARSKGPGFGNSYSPDGGLTIQDNGTAGEVNRKAKAYRAEVRVDFGDVTNGKAEGAVTGRVEHYEKGFSSLDVQAEEKKTAWGIEGDVKINERSRVAVVYSQQDTGKDTTDREGQAKVRVAVSDHVAIEPFGTYTERKRSGINSDDAGKRANVGGRLIYTWNEDEEVYVFGQATVARAGALRKDHRAGVGGKVRLSERVSVDGETSYGTLGFAADVMLNYEPTAETRYYIGYRLESDRDGSSSWPFELVGDDLGTVVAGAKVQWNDSWSAYAEDSYDAFGERQSLTQSYGVTYTPDERWTIGGGVEVGTVFDNTVDPDTGVKNSDFDRNAFSGTVGYKDDGITARVKGEARFDDSEDDTRDLNSYLLQADVKLQISNDWRALGTLDAVFTDATDAIKDGDYMEGSFGFAYRPENSDRLNALIKYTYLLDEPGQDQVTIDGTKNGDAQRSHIFSADVSYDVVPQLTIGAKYGVRFGETREREPGSEWEKSQAHLGILRADLHIVHEWDALIEGRVMWSPTTDQTDYGLLVALYKQMGDNFKVGVGYNFGQFSDDLRDLTFDDSGVFLNVVGKI